MPWQVIFNRLDQIIDAFTRECRNGNDMPVGPTDVSENFWIRYITFVDDYDFRDVCGPYVVKHFSHRGDLFSWRIGRPVDDMK